MAEAHTESHRRRASPVGSILLDAEAEAPVVDSDPPSVMDMDTGSDLQPSGRPPTNTPTDRDTINSTRSLYDDDIVYNVENARVYCGGYYMPCDEEETDRLQLQHQVYLRLSNGELTTVPLKNPTKILDVGTGKGDWAMAIADHYPDAEVIGTDIAKIQPTAVPPNCFFEIDDAEDESGWTFAEDDFDLIHFRNMVGAFEDWDRIYAETWTHLKPGGWIEVLDFDEHKGLLSLFTPNSEINNFFRVIKEASEKSGRPRTIKHLEPQRLIAAGFDDIHLTEYEIPFGQWHEDKEKKFLGKLWMTICLAGMEALSLRIVTKEMGWEATEVRRMCELVAKEVETFAKDKDRVKGAMVKLKVLRAKKPELDGSEGLVIDIDDDDDDDDDNE